MTEYGLFTSEGCIEAGLWSPGEAEGRLAQLERDGTVVQTDSDPTTWEEICPDHPEEPRGQCGECFGGAAP